MMWWISLPQYRTHRVHGSPPYAGPGVHRAHEAERLEARGVLHPAGVPGLPHPSVPAEAAQRDENAEKLEDILASQNYGYSYAGRLFFSFFSTHTHTHTHHTYTHARTHTHTHTRMHGLVRRPSCAWLWNGGNFCGRKTL